MSLTALLQSRGGTSWRLHLACAFLAILAVLWRLPFAINQPVTTVDEVRFAIPTVERLIQGDWVFYVAGTDYGAPTQEALSAMLARFFGESALTLRFPALLFGALAAVVAFWSVRETAGVGVAFGIAALLTFGNSAVCRYTTFAHPCYATVYFLVGVIQLATFWTDRKRTPWRWAVLAVLMGFSLYVLKISIIQSGISLAWLWYRSDHGKRCLAALRTMNRPRTIYGFAAIAFAVLALLPVIYRFLTRRSVYSISKLEILLLGVTALAFLAGMLLLAPTFVIPRRNESLVAALCFACLVLIPMPAAVWFKRIEQPRMAEHHVEPYGEIAYSWKHVHEWPKQVRILAEGIFPAILVGRYDRMEHSLEATWPLTWESGITFFAVAALGVGATRRSNFSLSWRRLGDKDWVIILPFFAMLAIMLPSWSLFGDSSYRYLMPFLPGLYLLAFRCLEQPIMRHQRLVTLMLVVYFVYCGIDCALHVAP